MELIQREWNLQHFGSPNYIWESKLRLVRETLKKWVKEGFENPNKQKIILQSDLAAMHLRMEVEEVFIEHLKQEKDMNIIIRKATR